MLNCEQEMQNSEQERSNRVHLSQNSEPQRLNIEQERHDLEILDFRDSMRAGYRWKMLGSEQLWLENKQKRLGSEQEGLDNVQVVCTA